MINPERLREFLAVTCPGENWFAGLWRSDGVRAEASGGRISELVRWSSSTITLLVEARGGVGFSSLPLGPGGLTPETARELAGRARDSAGVAGSEGKTVLPERVAKADSTHLDIFDEETSRLTPEELCRFALAIESGALSVGDDAEKAVRKPSVRSVVETRALFDADGNTARWRATDFEAFAETAVERSGSAEFGWVAKHSRRGVGIDFKAVGREATTRGLELLDARKVPTGRFPILLDTRTATDLLETLAPSFLGENHLKGKSLLLGRLGERVFPELLSIVDDGLLAGGCDTQPVDDEGTPRSRVEVVNAGRVSGLLYDLSSAGRAKTASTGNGSGSPSGPVLPDVTNFFVQPGGSGDESAMLADLGRGLWVRDLMGLHTVDPVSGDFSLGCAGLWVENGKPVHPVSGGAISGNLIDLFSHLVSVGSEVEFHGSLGSPPLIFDGVDLAGG